MARKYARIFVRGHYLFREANSFPRAKLEENCELRGTVNVQGQISEHIFAPNGDYCPYYPSNLFRNARSFENWGIFSRTSLDIEVRGSKNLTEESNKLISQCQAPDGQQGLIAPVETF